MGGRERDPIANVTRMHVRAREWVPGWALVPLRTIRTRFVFKVLRCFCTDRVNPALLEQTPFTVQVLTAKIVREVAADPELDMTPEFVAEAVSKGDACLGVFDGDTLAAYTWYSSKPTRIVPPDLVLHFDDAYMYIYKAFTRPRYRGQRLHAIGKTTALKGYQAQGFLGLLSYVEYLNFSSIKSVKRIGGKQFGSIWVIGAFGHYLIHRSRGCHRFGFRMERVRGARDAPATVPSLTT